MQKMTFAIFLEIDDVIRNEDTLDFNGPGADPASCVKGNLLQSGIEIYEIDFGSFLCKKLWDNRITGKCTLNDQQWGSESRIRESWYTQLNEFNYNGKAIRGNIIMRNLSPNFDSMSLETYIDINDGRDNIKIFTSNSNLKIIEGGSTATVRDNKYLVTPYSLSIGNGFTPQNYYQGDASERFILDVPCNGYFLSGSMLIDSYENKIPGTINYGTGTCDNIGSWIFQGKPNEVKFE